MAYNKFVWDSALSFLEKDKVISPLIKKHGYCKITKRDRSLYFEDLVESIVSQQLSIKAAATIFSRLKTSINGKFTPEKLLAIKDQEFKSFGISRQKTGYIKDLATKVKENLLQLDKLDSFDDEKVKTQLVSVKGIGGWTADMFLMFTLARPDIFPSGDLGIQNAFKKAFPKTNITKQSMEKIAEKWKPYRTVASWYLWRILE